MKKITAIVLCVLMVLTCIPLASFAKEVANGKCGTNLYWSYDDETHTLTFTGSGDMTDYGLFNSAPWYSYRSEITDIEFSDEMKSIGDYAFYECTALFSVKIPDNITNLGVSSFSQCSSLENVKVSDNVEEIRSFDFYHCDKLVNFIVGKKVVSINQEAFNDCDSLKKIYLGDSTQLIKSYAFSKCDSLEKLIISKSTTEFESFSLKQCNKLKDVYYLGTEEDWKKITDNTSYLSDTTKVYNAHEHIEGEWTVYRAPTCTARGTEIKECTVCGALLDFQLLAPKHTFTNYVYNEDAKCEVDGTETAKCDFCDTYDTRTATGTALSHSFTNYVYNEDAKCGVNGTKTAKCDNCNETNTITAEGTALKHSFTKYVYNKDAKCGVNGTKTAKCNYCSKTKTITAKGTALKHTYKKYTYNKNATCTANGTETAKCKYCGKTKTRTATGTALGHKMTFRPKVEATYTKAGKIAYYHCSKCGKNFSDKNGKVELKASALTSPAKKMPFKDVRKTDWFYSSVAYCVNKGYFEGMTSDTFLPNDPLTREQFMQILFNISGESPAKYKSASTYADVPTGEWYSAAIKWAEVNGITHGMGKNYFGLGERITREQFALLLMNYAKKLGYKTVERDTLENFEDTHQISGWAREAVEWAVAEQLIFGTTEKTLSPTKVTTRAAATMIFMHFDDFLARQNAQ